MAEHLGRAAGSGWVDGPGPAPASEPTKGAQSRRRRAHVWMPWREVLRLPHRHPGKVTSIGPRVYLDLSKGREDLGWRFSSPATGKVRWYGLGPLRLGVT